jgi:hypothetical protein
MRKGKINATKIWREISIILQLYLGENKIKTTMSRLENVIHRKGLL